jgi:phage tail-like protein
MAERIDPLESYTFAVEIEGVVVAGFQEVSGLESRIQVIEYREGTDASLTVRKLPGRVSYSNLVLKTGVTQDKSLFEWYLQWVRRDAAAKRKSIRVVLRDGAGVERLSWAVREAWPVAYIGPSLNAEANLVATQTFEIAYEGLELQ